MGVSEDFRCCCCYGQLEKVKKDGGEGKSKRDVDMNLSWSTRLWRYEDSQLFRELTAIYPVMPQEMIFIMCLKKDE